MIYYVKRTLLTAAALAALATSATPSAEARKIRTRHAIPKDSPKDNGPANSVMTSSISIMSDSALFCERVRPSIRFYGFDKTAASNMESFFISNGLDRTVSELVVIITYSDMKGRQLHRQEVKIDCTIPPGETRRTDIKSWDTQKSFYYHKSAKPKRQATPFDVRLELKSATFSDK